LKQKINVLKIKQLKLNAKNNSIKICEIKFSPYLYNIKQTKTDIMKAIKLTQEEVIKRSVEKLLEVKEDPYCTFWGFFKMDVKSKNVNRLELKSNEYYILRGERVFGVN